CVPSSSSGGSPVRFLLNGTLVADLSSSPVAALNDDYGELYQSHCSFQDVSNRLTDTQNQLVDVIYSRSNLFDDHKSLQQEHLKCAAKEVALVEKLATTKKEQGDLLDKSQE
nr:hypothetical protein [Tanacetum cinerariifolium]